MNKKFPVAVVVVLALLVVGLGGGAWWYVQNELPGKYDQFAQCLGEKGLKFYGAYWCSHCANQKKLFGKSVKYLPYVECATPGSGEMTAECKAKNIGGIPTWTGPNDEKTEGELTLDQLSARSSCPLPK